MNFFDVINIFGLLFTAVLVIPHIVYVRTHTYDKTVFDNRAMLYIDRIGRYCSAFLMFVNIGILEKGFTSELMKHYWIISTTVLLAAYLLLWLIFFKTGKKQIAYATVFLTAFIIIQSGLLQIKTLLFTFGIVYLAGDLYVTSRFFKNNRGK
ncbi:MAG: hypothetical protein Q4A46_05925 [Clostridia bacterium]|nr:hypothetical protein [Clostridia bacterium]